MSTKADEILSMGDVAKILRISGRDRERTARHRLARLGKARGVSYFVPHGGRAWVTNRLLLELAFPFLRSRSVDPFENLSLAVSVLQNDVEQLKKRVSYLE